MVHSVQHAPQGASAITVANGSEVGVASDSDDWFGSIARQLLGKDAGFGLHLVTGVPEGSCYKYTTRKPENRRQPPGYLIVQLLRSEQGRQWLSALMHGSTAQWWQDLELALRIVALLNSRNQGVT
jgi:hypothetical protein